MPSFSCDLPQALDIAIAASKKAAEHAVQHWENIDSLEIESKSPGDFVTQVDRECQHIIVEEIQSTFHEHRFLGEEGGTDTLGDPESPYQWIIDPIDGTTPFIHKKDTFGNLIALQENGHTVLGLIYIPVRNELFTGYKGGGAYFNDSPIRLRDTKDMFDAVLCSNTMRRAKEIDGTYMISTPRCGSLHNYGSMAHEMGELLKGCNDGSFAIGARLWDVAPGCFLTEEAGGKSWYELVEPDNLTGGTRHIASTPPIFDEIKEWVDNHF